MNICSAPCNTSGTEKLPTFHVNRLALLTGFLWFVPGPLISVYPSADARSITHDWWVTAVQHVILAPLPCRLGVCTMIVVIFEVEMKPGRAQEYFDLAAKLRPELEKVDGFLSVERFQSVTTSGKYLSVSFWRDEQAVREWKAHVEHGAAQQRGKKEIFADYRIRVADVLRDYSMHDNQPLAKD